MRSTSLTILLLLAACQSALQEEISDQPHMQTIRFLALGDSYTIGESTAEEDRWPIRLAALLEADGIAVETTIIARTGWTTDELWQGIQSRRIEPPYDLVSLLIGVNNQYRGSDLDMYRREFTFLLNKSIAYAGGHPHRVVVLSIPDWGVTPFASGRDRAQIAREVDRFNLVNRNEAEKAGVHYVDVTPFSRQAAADPGLLASDGLHPSGRMYAEWARLVHPVAREILVSGE